MSERYSKIYSLPENLYAQGSPILIKAGALLKDNETGKLIVQLKLHSISNQAIKFVKVEITLFDSVDRQLDDAVIFNYLDLSASRGSDFGVKTPIGIPNATTRSYTVRVVEVGFFDKTIWQGDQSKWSKIATQTKIGNKLKDVHAEIGYRARFGEKADFALLEHSDLWLCTCGEINHDYEKYCRVCDTSLEELKGISAETLVTEGKYISACKMSEINKIDTVRRAIAEFEKINNYKDSADRINTCEKKIISLENEARTLEQKKKKAKKILTISFSSTAGIFALLLMFFLLIIPGVRYDKAEKELKAANYDNAATYYNAASYYGSYDYKDSIDKYFESRYLYACELIENSNYTLAKEILISLYNSDYEPAKTNKEKYAELIGDCEYKRRYFAEAVMWYEKSNVSSEVISDTKYNYVLSAYTTKNNQDKVAYIYLKDLKTINYKNSSNIYDELYSWKITIIAINNKKDSNTPMTSLSATEPIYVHFALEGGTPGEKTIPYVKYVLPNGKTKSYTFTGEFGESTLWFAWPDGLSTNVGTGTLTIALYTSSSSSQPAATCSIIIY